MCSSVALVIVSLFFVVDADPYYFPDWKQCYYAWKNYPIGKSNETLCSKGDTTTSLVIWMASHGFEGNPCALNTWLNNNNGYQGSNILWSRAADAWTMSYVGGYRPDDFRYDKSCTCIDNGMGVLAQIDGCDSSFYVVLTSCNCVHGMYTIRDPTGCYDKTGTIHAYDVKWYVVFR